MNFNDFQNHINNFENSYSTKGLKILFDYLNTEHNDNVIDPINIIENFKECKIVEALSENNLNSITELEHNTIVLKVSNDTIIYYTY